MPSDVIPPDAIAFGCTAVLTPFILLLPGGLLGAAAGPLALVAIFVVGGLPSYFLFGLPLGWRALRRAGQTTINGVAHSLLGAALVAHALGTVVVFVIMAVGVLDGSGRWSDATRITVFYAIAGAIAALGMTVAFTFIYAALARRSLDFSPTGAAAP